MPIENWDDKEIIDTDNGSEPAGDLDLKKNEELPIQEKRKRFFQSLNNKFMAMAMAGFLTLGSGWQESFADQIKLTRKDRGTITFSMEEGIKENSLKDFEKKLEEDEPKFMKWLEQYLKGVVVGIDGLTEQMLEPNEKEIQKAEKRLEKSINYSLRMDSAAGQSPEQVLETMTKFSKIRQDNKKVLDYAKKNPESIRNANRFLKEHIKDIILGNIFIDNSKAVRDQMMTSIQSPDISFGAYDVNQIYGIAAYSGISEQVGNNGEIKDSRNYLVITPSSFIFTSGEVDLTAYKNAFVHELGHTIRPRPHNELTPLWRALNEGRVQNIAFEILQYLSKNNSGAEPFIGFQIYYDNLVITASILESVAKSSSYEDLMANWHAGLIDDQELLVKLEIASKEVGVGSTTKYIKNFATSFEEKEYTEIVEASALLASQLLYSIGAGNIKPSAEIMKKILISGRKIGDQQKEIIEKQEGNWRRHTLSVLKNESEEN